LITLSRTPAYSFFRFVGALFAGFASLGWILERTFGADYSVDLVVDRVAQRGAWIAPALFLISIVLWLWREMRGKPRAISEKQCHPSLEGI
jgi:hypothetical protein